MLDPKLLVPVAKEALPTTGKLSCEQVIGLTATPYRMDCGPLTDGVVFDAIAFDYPISTATKSGFISPLVYMRPSVVPDFESVRLKGKEFVEAEVQKTWLLRSKVDGKERGRPSEFDRRRKCCHSSRNADPEFGVRMRLRVMSING